MVVGVERGCLLPDACTLRDFTHDSLVAKGRRKANIDQQDHREALYD
jgi:hypothetical protein